MVQTNQIVELLLCRRIDSKLRAYRWIAWIFCRSALGFMVVELCARNEIAQMVVAVIVVAVDIAVLVVVVIVVVAAVALLSLIELQLQLQL